MTLRRLLVILPLLLLAVHSGENRVEGKGWDESSAIVCRVNDGDTVTALVGNRYERIRLIGIDAPEMGQEPWGEIAKRHLRTMIISTSRTVRIEYDIETRDKYGRLLAYLRMKNGKLVNSVMLREGYAVLFTFPPNVRHNGAFIEAEREARSRKLGIWSQKGLKQKPVDYRRSHPRVR